MKRGKPLRRKTPLRSRGKTSYRRRPRDLEYMRTVKKLACIVRAAWRDHFVEMLMQGAVATPCGGRVQADHMGERAFGKKADDTTCVPICRNHHGERTDYRGVFKNWTKVEMRQFCDWAINWTRCELEEMNHGRS